MKPATAEHDEHNRRHITLDDVKHWAISYGQIGHVLMRRDSNGWYWTACGSLGPSFDATTDRPKRICRKCRQAVQDGKIVEPIPEARRNE